MEKQHENKKMAVKKISLLLGNKLRQVAKNCLFNFLITFMHFFLTQEELQIKTSLKHRHYRCFKTCAGESALL